MSLANSTNDAVNEEIMKLEYLSIAEPLENRQHAIITPTPSGEGNGEETGHRS